MTSVVPDQPRTLTQSTVAELVRWRPAHGVLSLYADADPADRGGRWRIELRNGLDRAIEAGARGDRETQLAVEETVKRIEQVLLTEPTEAGGRGLIGFVEANRGPGEERWYAAQVAPRRTEARYGRAPHVSPLIEMLDDGAPVGIVAVSAERVRLFHWHLGRLEQLHDWELDVFSLDWRERKAPGPSDPAAGQMVSAAGRDQYNQRLESNRERFAHQTGALAQVSVAEYGWSRILVFGGERYTPHFAQGFAGRCELRQVESSDLVSQPTQLIEERVERLLPVLNRDRERVLIERVKEAAFAEARGSFGAQETLQALEEGRVEHLIYDAERDHPDVERMIELALSTGAAITPVEGESAAALEEQGGVAALLRY